MSKVNIVNYYRPLTLTAALDFLNEQQEPAFLAAGGTDIIPRMRRPNMIPRNVIDISALSHELGNIELQDDGLYIGSMATHTQICSSPLIKKYVPVLAQACQTIGSRQIRNRATIGGNIANASPAGDSMPALLTMDAVIYLQTKNSSRTAKLSEIIKGPSKTDIAYNELITGIRIPRCRLGDTGWYKKMSNRNAMTISLVSAAIAEEKSGMLHLAFGSVAPVPIQFPEIEQRYMENKDIGQLISDIGNAVHPISDVRASAQYRKEITMNLVREGLYSLGILSCRTEDV